MDLSKHFFVRSALSCSAAGLLALALGLTGCSSTPTIDEDSYGHVKLKRPEKIVYEQISAAGCELAVPLDVPAVAGTPLELDVQLINESRRELCIKEWYMIDQYNFAVYYRQVPADRPLDKHTPFKSYKVAIPLKPLPRHAELRLRPGNRAMLTVTLPFTGNLNPGEQASFEVYLATNLNTFKIKSKRFMVHAR